MSGLRTPTFAEREGTKRLPTQLKTKELSDEVRALIWDIIYKSLKSNYQFSRSRDDMVTYRWEAILADYWVKIDHKFTDDFKLNFSNLVLYGKSLLTKDYAIVLEFVEFICNHDLCPLEIEKNFNQAFQSSGFAYRIHNKSIIPVSSEEMANAVVRSLDDLNNFSAATSHLRAAAHNLSTGRFADSVRESIHAVESVARTIIPSANTLAPALNEYEKHFSLHPALKKGFASLYGYTSDSEGIRHALIEGPESKVTESEALYMLGSCASFASFLANGIRN